MKILTNKQYGDLLLKSTRGMFGAVTDDMLLRNNAFINEENKQLKDNWNKLKEYINNQWLDDKGIITRIKDKIELIEKGSEE